MDDWFGACARPLRGAACRGLGACALLLALAPLVQAAEPGPHVHGRAALRIAIDGERVEIDLDGPLDNLLGFEHAPRDERERAAVRAMAATLRRPATLFAMPPAARCVPGAVHLSSGVLPSALLGEPAPRPAAAAAEPDGHADLDAGFVFICADPSRLDGLDVRLSQAFPKLNRIDVQVAGPKGQSATVLTAGKTRVAW